MIPLPPAHYAGSVDFDNEKLMDKGNIYEMWSKYVARKE